MGKKFGFFTKNIHGNKKGLILVQQIWYISMQRQMFF